MKCHIFGVHNQTSCKPYSMERDDIKKKDSLDCSIFWLEKVTIKTMGRLPGRTSLCYV